MARAYSGLSLLMARASLLFLELRLEPWSLYVSKKRKRFEEKISEQEKQERRFVRRIFKREKKI
jgi:hypothetical protein